VSADSAPYGKANADPITPFFRFPGFVSSAALLDYLEQRGIVVFGKDVWASDWLRMSANQQLQLVFRRIEAAHGGIVLFHDTKAQTATMLPGLSRALKVAGLVSFTWFLRPAHPLSDYHERHQFPVGSGSEDAQKVSVTL